MYVNIQRVLVAMTDGYADPQCRLCHSTSFRPGSTPSSSPGARRRFPHWLYRCRSRPDLYACHPAPLCRRPLISHLTKANAPLSIRNKKTASTSFIAGDELAFTSTISADPANAFCAMLVGGASETVNFPLEQCAVPAGVDGPVFVFLTSSATPLAADINKQAQDTILAGPGVGCLHSYRLLTMLTV